MDCELADITHIDDSHNTKQQNMASSENPGEPLLVQKTGSSAAQRMDPDTQTECIIWKPLTLIRKRRGQVIAFLSTAVFSVQSVCLDVLTDTIDSFQVVLMFVPVKVICCFVFILWAKIAPPSCSNYKHYLWLLACGLCQTFNTCSFALVVSYLTVGDAVTIVYTAVIQVSFFSWLILKEPMRLFDLMFAILAFVGVFFIARPPFIFGSDEDYTASKSNLLGVVYALAGSCIGALLLILNRKLSILGVHSFICLFSNSSMVLVTSGIICIFLNRWRCPTFHEWLYALVAGASYFSGNAMLFYSLKTEKATLVTVLLTMEIVFAYLWQILFLHMLPSWTSYIGASLIVAASIGIPLKNKPSQSADEATDDDSERAGSQSLLDHPKDSKNTKTR